MLKTLQYDLGRNKKNYKSIFIIVFFRINNYFEKRKANKIMFIVGLPIKISYRLIVECVLSVEIPSSVNIGAGFRLHHGQGLVINSKTIIGERVTLKHNTTIGANTDRDENFLGAPIIGNDVIVGPHTIIYGNIIIGDGAIIAPGSVVRKNIEPYTLYSGNPAVKIK